MAYLDRDRSVSVLYTIRGPNQQAVSVSRFSVQSFPQSQNTCIRHVQLKVALVPRHQTISEMPQCVRIGGPQGSHHLSNRKILRHGVFQRCVVKRWRTVIPVQNSNPDLLDKIAKLMFHVGIL